MVYSVDPFDRSRPVGADDAGGLTNELRSIKSILVRFRDGVEKEFNDLNELMETEGLPIELGGTGATNLVEARENLGIVDPAEGLGFEGFLAFGPGLHTWAIPSVLKGTGRKFLVAISGGGGGALTHTSGVSQSPGGGAGGLSVDLLTTDESSIQILVGSKGLVDGRDGGDSYFGTLMFADGGTTPPNYGWISAHGAARGGTLNITGGGSKGGTSWRLHSHPKPPNRADDGVDGFCVIVW